MTPEWIGVLAMYGLTMLLAIPRGNYIANVFADKPTRNGGPLLGFMSPLERLIYRL